MTPSQEVLESVKYWLEQGAVIKRKDKNEEVLKISDDGKVCNCSLDITYQEGIL